MTATKEDVIACYRLILGREPDPEGLSAHLNAKLPRELLIRGFIDSAEYRTKTNGSQPVSLYGRTFQVGKATMYADGYESYVFRRLMPLLGPGKRFLDVGANVGMFAVHAALRGAEVLAIEARPSNAALLLQNCRSNGVTVELHPLAVSDRHGYAVFDFSAENEDAGIIRQESLTVGDYVVATGLLDELVGTRSVDVMKIDIEGSEYRALQGARSMLERSRPVIVTEYEPRLQQECSGVSGAEYLRFLKSYGYSIAALLRTGEVLPIHEFWEADAIVSNVGHHIDLLLET